MYARRYNVPKLYHSIKEGATTTSHRILLSEIQFASMTNVEF
jgi:hypothetical protein